jgi:Holliday junction resolvase RusA-like endonuclease
MKLIKFTIPGEPCAQGRPRFSTIGGYVKAIDPAKSRNQKAFVKYLATTAAKQQGWTYTDLPLYVEIIAYMGIPKSKPKKWRTAAIRGQERPTKKPDVDNLFKLVTDALSGVIYADDKQIVSCRVQKWYSEEPRTEVKIAEVIDNAVD